MRPAQEFQYFLRKSVKLEEYKLGQRRTGLLRDFSASVTSRLAMPRRSVSGRGEGKQLNFADCVGAKC